MRDILKSRPLRFVFLANMISMMGSGLSQAGTTWYIFQTTKSEESLGILVLLVSVPAILMLPFTGVLIDREDRRHLLMWLDAARAVIVLAVAIGALFARVEVWHLYLMNTLVAAGFWMFWPTITALIQELSPETEFVHANTFLLAGVQAGWLIAGSIVGFVYDYIGLSGVLFIDFGTYMLSFACYFAVRRGRHVVKPAPVEGSAAPPEGLVARYVHELKEGLVYLHGRPYVVLLGISWALFIGAMLTQGVITAPLSHRILDAGAKGFGWLNAGWAIGAVLSVLYAPAAIRWLGARHSVSLSMAVLSACLLTLPFSALLPLAVLLYVVMGSARGVGGVSITSSMMQYVPPHFMGRVQNTFFFLGTVLQLALGYGVGVVSHRVSLTAGFFIVGGLYAVAAIAAAWPVAVPVQANAAAETPTAD